MGDLLIVERRDAVALVTLNRPQKRNALSIDLRLLIAETFRALALDEALSAAVLTGAPPAFCAGMDKSQFGGDDANRRALFESSIGAFAAVWEFPLPLIAAVNGPALGGGFALAASCDVRFASHSATFGHPEVALGIPASYATLLRALPEQAARELAFTGRVIGADEALALGAVREITSDPVQHALGLAAEMAKHGRRVLEQTKRIVLEAHEGGAPRRAWDAEMRLFGKVLLGGAGAELGKP